MTDGAPPRYEPIAVSSESTVVAEFVADVAQEAGYQSEAELERVFIALLEEQAYEYLPLTSEVELLANLRAQLEALNGIEFSDAEWATAIADALNAQETRRKIPWIVCLCGSTRFREAFEQANYELTMAEQIVLSVGWYPHAPDGHGEDVGHDSDEKIRLDELHKRKIDLADEVHVLNVGGYIGESTRSEIEYAIETGKTVSYLEES